MRERFKEARRAYDKLLQKHREELMERDAFEDADRSICPEVWDEWRARSGPPEFINAAGDIEQRLFLQVCDAYGLDPARFDDALSAMYWDEVNTLAAVG